jgi:predicted dehydrogenase
VKIKIALLGCGYWGKNFLRLLSRHPQVELVAACDMDAALLAELQPQYPTTPMLTDWQQVLALPDLQAVVICTSAASHYNLASAFLRRGVHVLCEKPLTLTSAEAQSLADIAAEQGKVLMTGHTFLFNPAVRHIRHLIHEKSFGKPLYAHLQRTGLGIVRRDVDVIWDVAPHDIAILLYLLDEKPSSVTAFSMSHHREDHAEVAFLMLEFPSKMLVKVHVSWLDPIKTRKVTLVGENQMIVFDDTSISEKVTIHQKNSSYQPNTGEYGDFQAAMRAGDILIPHLPSTEPLKLEVEEFLQAIEQGGSYLSDGNFSVEVIRILEAAQRSAATGNQRIPL